MSVKHDSHIDTQTPPAAVRLILLVPKVQLSQSSSLSMRPLFSPAFVPEPSKPAYDGLFLISLPNVPTCQTRGVVVLMEQGFHHEANGDVFCCSTAFKALQQKKRTKTEGRNYFWMEII